MTWIPRWLDEAIPLPLKSIHQNFDIRYSKDASQQIPMIGIIVLFGLLFVKYHVNYKWRLRHPKVFEKL